VLLISQSHQEKRHFNYKFPLIGLMHSIGHQGLNGKPVAPFASVDVDIYRNN